MHLKEADSLECAVWSGKTIIREGATSEMKIYIIFRVKKEMRNEIMYFQREIYWVILNSWAEL